MNLAPVMTAASSSPAAPPLSSPRLGQQLAERHRTRRPYELRDHPMLERQRRLESNARSYPRRLPLALARAQGIYVEDIEGRVFIDCLAGAGTLALGHNHPAVSDAIERTLRSGLPLHTLDLTTPVKDRFVQDLWSVLPEALARHARIQFCGPSGADAVEAALKLVRTATGRSTVLAFHGAYHGMTHGALMLMGNLGPKVALGGALSGVQFMPYPYDLRCPFGLHGEAGVDAGLAYIESVLADPESGVPQPAAIILETVQGEGGVIPAPLRWLQGVRALATRFDIPLIVDEIQAGFARTGRMFSFEHAGIEPDVVVLSKAIGGGLPLSVVVYHEKLDVWRPGAHAGTFRGNQLAMAAGSATLEVLREQQVERAVAAKGEWLMQALRQLEREFDCIAEVRGRGLMAGIELAAPSDTAGGDGAPSRSALATRLQQECLRHGLIVELGGRHGSVVRLLPPLIIEPAELAEVVSILRMALLRAQTT